MSFYDELLQTTQAEQAGLQSLPIIQAAQAGPVTHSQ